MPDLVFNYFAQVTMKGSIYAIDCQSMNCRSTHSKSGSAGCKAAKPDFVYDSTLPIKTTRKKEMEHLFSRLVSSIRDLFRVSSAHYTILYEIPINRQMFKCKDL